MELLNANLQVRSNEPVPIEYKGARVGQPLKIDLLVEGAVIIETKAAERYNPIHLAQVITYLKLTGCPAGLLMNFHCATLLAGLKRAYHPDHYAARRRGADG